MTVKKPTTTTLNSTPAAAATASTPRARMNAERMRTGPGTSTCRRGTSRSEPSSGRRRATRRTDRPEGTSLTVATGAGEVIGAAVAGWGSGRRPNMATANPTVDNATTARPTISVGTASLHRSRMRIRPRRRDQYEMMVTDP